MPGKVYLIVGERGVGKTTFAMQIARHIGKYGNTAFVSFEESSLGRTIDRIGGRSSFLFDYPDAHVFDPSFAANGTVKALFVDSIQSMVTSEMVQKDYHLGSAASYRSATKAVNAFAQDKSAAVVLLGGLTRGRQFPGRKTVTTSIYSTIRLERLVGCTRFVVMSNKALIGTSVMVMRSDGFR